MSDSFVHPICVCPESQVCTVLSRSCLWYLAGKYTARASARHRDANDFFLLLDRKKKGTCPDLCYLLRALHNSGKIELQLKQSSCGWW